MNIAKLKTALQRRHDAGMRTGGDRMNLDALEYIGQLESELAAQETLIAKHVVNGLTYADRVHGLQDELAAYKEKMPLSPDGIGPHGVDGTDCQTFYDSCNCTVETLNYNIDRAERFKTILEQYRWVPVSERLPEEKEEVLMATSYGLVTTVKYQNDSYVRLFGCRRCAGLSLGSVTHWMPIPPLPKGDKT